MAEQQNLLWDYALDVYARAGVMEACLCLQDRANIDVILLLAAGYLGHTGRGLNEQELQRYAALGAMPRQHFVLPLRKLRRELDESAASPAQQACYGALKEAELAAECWQVEQLWAAMADGEGACPAADRAALIQENLALFAPNCRCETSREALTRLERELVQCAASS